MPSPSYWMITGASSGLGEAVATEARRRGARLVVTSRSGDREGRWSGAPDVLPLALDLTDPHAIDKAVAATLDFGGVPDVLVSNAGAAVVASIESTPEEVFRAQMELHFHGPMRLLKAFVPGMRERGSGVIVGIGAAAVVDNYPGFGAYGAAKAAMAAALDAVRKETEAHGVQVTTVHPGPFRTGFAARCLAASPPAEAAYSRSVGRFSRLLASLDGRQPGDPEAAARAIVDLATRGRPPALAALGRYMAGKCETRAAELRAAAAVAIATPTDFPPGT